MKVLAFDSSQIQSCVCFIQDDVLIHSEYGSTAITHSEGLLALIDRVLIKSKTSLLEIDSFAAGYGPGSFTGLRIGLASAKAFAQIFKKNIYGFSSLFALASSGPARVAMANAYQGQVFVGWNDGKWHEQALTVDQWCDQQLTAMTDVDSAISFCGSGVETYWKLIHEKASFLGKSVIKFDVPNVRAEGIVEAIKHSKPQTYCQLQPNYIRPSQAEIKLLALNG